MRIVALSTKQSSSVGFLFFLRSTAAAMTSPGMQKPHCETLSSMKASCTGWSRSREFHWLGGLRARFTLGNGHDSELHRQRDRS